LPRRAAAETSSCGSRTPSSSGPRSGSARSISQSAGATASRSQGRTGAARRPFSTLLGRLPLAAGNRRLGSGVVLGELEQDRVALSGSKPLLEIFRDHEEGTARTLLAKFGLGADDVLRSASSLSPGERTRAGLALLTARGVNCLILDEPTNHLDVEAIEELERALAAYDGTVVLVTHDRRFLEAFAPTRTIEL
jgi:ATPase subunit of ABC transporter with duplicated ATPase domains